MIRIHDLQLMPSRRRAWSGRRGRPRPRREWSRVGGLYSLLPGCGKVVQLEALLLEARAGEEVPRPAGDGSPFLDHVPSGLRLSKVAGRPAHETLQHKTRDAIIEGW